MGVRAVKQGPRGICASPCSEQDSLNSAEAEVLVLRALLLAAVPCGLPQTSYVLCFLSVFSICPLTSLNSFFFNMSKQCSEGDSHRITVQIIIISRHDIKVEKPSTQKLGNIRIDIASIL